MNETSYRTILRSSSIIGSAQAVNILVNIIKIKILATLLGPFGVGLTGLYSSIIQTGATIAGLGLGTVGTRQIAAANASDDHVALGRVRKALFWGTMVLAVVGAAGIWAAKVPIARLVLGDPARGGEVGWLALGVALTVASASQAALLTGLRRLGDLARLQVSASIAAAALGILAIWLWGTAGVLVLVLAAPAVFFIVGHLFVLRLPKAKGGLASLADISGELRGMAAMGLAVMVSALATVLGQLLVRVIVQQELGSVPLGFFQAAFAISTTYLGLVFTAMGTDYFPRLSGVIATPATAARLVNEQTEVGLLLCGPVLIGVLGLAPWVVELLYSSEFAPAVRILRWQLLGDILKVMSWPLGFVLLALGSGKAFTLAETIGVAVLVLGTWFGMVPFGLASPGIAYFAMYVIYLPLVYWLCNRRIGVRWSRAVMVQASAILGAAVFVDILASWSIWFGAIGGILCATMLGLWAVLRISEMAELGGRLAKLAGFSRKLKQWLTMRS